MKEPFEDKMSKQFRDALENYQVPYNQEAWERIKKQLPLAPAPVRNYWKSYVAWTAAIVVGGLILYFGYLSETNTNPINQPANNQIFNSTKESNSSSTMNLGSQTFSEPTKISDSQKSSSKEIYSFRRISGQEAGLPVRTEIFESIPKNEIFTGIKIPGINGEIYKPDTIENYSELERMQVAEIHESATKKRKSKFKLPDIKLDFSGNQPSRFVGPNKLSLFYIPEFQFEKSLHNPGFGHGFGIEFEGPINQSINLAIGLNFHSQQYSNMQSFHLDSSYHQTPNVAFVDSIINLSGKYQFLELPITLRIKLYSNQKVSLFFDGGLSAYAFLNQEYTTFTVVGKREYHDVILKRPWQNIHPLGSINLGLTCRYSLTERLSLGVSSEYKNHLTKLGALPMELNRFSAKIGITYRFGRNDEN